MSQLLQSRFFLVLLLVTAFPSMAYMGPGAGLTAFGCLVALLAGIWYTCKGFIWLPLKRRFKKNQTETTPEIEKTTALNEQTQSDPQVKKTS